MHIGAKQSARKKNNIKKNRTSLLWLFFFLSQRIFVFLFPPQKIRLLMRLLFRQRGLGKCTRLSIYEKIDIGGLMKWLKQGFRAATMPLWCDSSSGSGFSKLIITLLITLCHWVFSSSTDVVAPTDTNAGLQALPAYCSTLLGERRRFGTVSSAALPDFIRGCDDQQTFMWHTAWHLYQQS